MTVIAPQLHRCKSPAEAVASLVGEPLQLDAVEPRDMSDAARSLLVHHGHMTEVLERRNGGPLSLTVAKDYLSDGVYWRKILLHAKDAAGTPRLVEYGVVRIFLQYLPKTATDEILSRRTPLGRVLISHDVLRRVDPRWYVRMAAGEIEAYFGHPPHPLPLFGRIGIIHCNGEAAIEVLEVVTDEPTTKYREQT